MRLKVNVVDPDRQYLDYMNKHVNGVREAFDTIMYPAIKDDIDDTMLSKIKDLIDHHDESKYSEEEWVPYRDRFYGHQKDFDHAAFDRAWNHHQKCNPHHWNYWVLINDVDEPQLSAQEMPFEYIVELLCDWYSAGQYYGNTPSMWYDKCKDKMILHPNTRVLIEKYLPLFDTYDKLEERTHTVGDTQYWKRGDKYYKWTSSNGRSEIDKDSYYDAISGVEDIVGKYPDVVTPELAKHLDSENNKMAKFLSSDNLGDRGYASIEMDNGQMFEKLNKKELISHLKDFEWDDKYEYDDDTSIALKYTDGSIVMSDNGGLVKIKDGVKTNLTKIPKRGIVGYVEDNPNTTVIYGDVEVENYNATLAGEKGTRYGTSEDEDDWRADLNY